MITWEDSPSNNHLDITSYLIMWRRASDGADTATYVTVPNTMGTMSYTVEGLEVYTEYALQIAATDAKCNGTFSQELRFFTLEGSECYVCACVHTRACVCVCLCTYVCL